MAAVPLKWETAIDVNKIYENREKIRTLT